MANPFVAEIRMFPGSFAPRGWAFCNGQLLSISQNTALFALIGTTYGGDGKSTFALPDLQGRAPLHQGEGPGLTERVLGETGGSDAVSLTEAQLPIHSHTIRGENAVANQDTPVGNAFAGSAKLPYSDTADSEMDVTAAGISGSSLPHNNLPPYLVVNFIIALQGIFPPRS
jgi:microcystin-dependent protein